MKSNRLAGCFVGLFTAFFLTEIVAAFQYIPTPLLKSVPAHDVVLIGKVDERVDGKVVVVPVQMIKGRREMSITLPAVWRPGTEFQHGPVTMEEGMTYLLQLRLDEKKKLALSKDFACWGVQAVKTPKDTYARAAIIAQQLATHIDDEDARQQTWADVFAKETDETIYHLLTELYMAAADEATVTFLLQCMNAGQERSSLMEYSALVIQKHSYQSAVPGLLKCLEKHDWACLYPATTLGKLKAKKAHDPIVKLITDEKVGNREYLLHALCYLEDPRSVPLLTEELKSFRDTNRGLHYSWGEPLQSVMNIPDRELQTLAAGLLRRLGHEVSLPDVDVEAVEDEQTKPE